MTAGGISYSGIVGDRKVTLPSVESWGTNMNILRDPPKSIVTRKIDKVFDTQQYTRMVEEASDDRYCENVQIYPRGVNPSVSVSYSNTGGGSKLMHIGKGSLTSGGSNNFDGQTAINESNPINNRPGFAQSASAWQSPGVSNGNTMAKYVHRIDLDGDFRPPVQPQSRLQPLSRTSRNLTNLYTNPGTPKWIERATCDESVYKRAIKDEFFNTNVTPTSTYHMGAIQSADTRNISSVNINNMMRENLTTFASTQKSENIHTGAIGQIPTNNIRNKVNHNIETMKITQQHDQPRQNSLNTNEYVRDKLNSEVHTNSKDNSFVNIETMKGTIDTNLRDQINIPVITNKRENMTAGAENGSHGVQLRNQINTTVNTNQNADYTKTNINTNPIELTNKTPITNVFSNQSAEYYKSDENRQVKPLEQNRNHTSAYTNPQNNREEYTQNILRDAKLQPKISSLEGFDGRGTKPIETFNNTNHILQPKNIHVQKGSYNQYAERFNEPTIFNHHNQYPVHQYGASQHDAGQHQYGASI